MRRTLLILLLTLVLALAIAPGAIAKTSGPAGSCPDDFELHRHDEHMEDHEGHHIGSTRDTNNDGYICVKHLSNELHVHMDNVLPLD